MARPRTFFGFTGEDADIAHRFALGALNNGADAHELSEVLWWAHSQVTRGGLDMHRFKMNGVVNFQHFPKTIKAAEKTFDEANAKGWDTLPPLPAVDDAWYADLAAKYKDTPRDELDDITAHILADAEARIQETTEVSSTDVAPAANPRKTEIENILAADPQRYRRENLGAELLTLTRAEIEPSTSSLSTNEAMEP